MKIRKAKKADFRKIQKIIFDAIKKIRLNPRLRKQLEIDYNLENIEKKWKKISMFVSESREVIQGCGRLEKNSELRMIYVNPKFQKKGFGSKMIKKLENLAKRKGFKKVHVKALPNAVGFYKRLGYKKVKKENDTTTKMEKKLI
jgi:putative acetyltransferase